MANKMTKKRKTDRDDELRPEYDLRKLSGGVRGKYYRSAKAGTNVALIDPDLATIFPTGEAVNRALRVLADAAQASRPKRLHRP
jgi:hypothetical protein